MNWEQNQRGILKMKSSVSSSYFDLFYLLEKGKFSWTKRIIRRLVPLHGPRE